MTNSLIATCFHAISSVSDVQGLPLGWYLPHKAVFLLPTIHFKAQYETTTLSISLFLLSEPTSSTAFQLFTIYILMSVGLALSLAVQTITTWQAFPANQTFDSISSTPSAFSHVYSTPPRRSTRTSKDPYTVSNTYTKPSPAAMGWIWIYPLRDKSAKRQIS